MEAEFDLVVIGSGPAGQKAAIQAAKLRKRVAVVERAESVGGVCVNTGTIPSKALREAVMHLTGAGKRELFVPRWYRLFSLVQALLPGLSARLVARQGYKRASPS